VVVSHDRQAMLRQCLAALEKSEGRERLQIVVVENGSMDGSEELDSEFPDLQWIRLPKNFGLTKAMNLGWRAADAEYVFFLHDRLPWFRPKPPCAWPMRWTPMRMRPRCARCWWTPKANPAPQFGSLPPDGVWRPAQAAGRCAGAGGISARRRLMGARLLHQGDAADRRALRPNRRRRRSGGAVSPRVEEVLLVPHGGACSIWAPANTPRSERADALLAHAAFIAKYQGFGPGMSARLGSIFGRCGFSFRRALRHTLAGRENRRLPVGWGHAPPLCAHKSPAPTRVNVTGFTF